MTDTRIHDVDQARHEAIAEYADRVNRSARLQPARDGYDEPFIVVGGMYVHAWADEVGVMRVALWTDAVKWPLTRPDGEVPLVIDHDAHTLWDNLPREEAYAGDRLAHLTTVQLAEIGRRVYNVMEFGDPDGKGQRGHDWGDGGDTLSAIDQVYDAFGVRFTDRNEGDDDGQGYRPFADADEGESVRGCRCGEADYGASGHDGDPAAKRKGYVLSVGADVDGKRVPVAEAGPFLGYREAFNLGYGLLGVSAGGVLDALGWEELEGGRAAEQACATIAGFTVEVVVDGETRYGLNTNLRRKTEPAQADWSASAKVTDVDVHALVGAECRDAVLVYRPNYGFEVVSKDDAFSQGERVIAYASDVLAKYGPAPLDDEPAHAAAAEINQSTTPPDPHGCGLCGGPLRFCCRDAEGIAGWVCDRCGWQHTSKDCCEAQTAR